MIHVLIITFEVFLLISSILLLSSTSYSESAKLKERFRLEVLLAHKKKEYLAVQEELYLLEEDDEEDEEQEADEEQEQETDEDEDQTQPSVAQPPSAVQVAQPPSDVQVAAPPSEKKALTSGQKEWFATVRAIQQKYHLSWRDALKRAGEERKETNSVKGSLQTEDDASATATATATVTDQQQKKSKTRDFSSWVEAKQLPPGTLFRTTIENITMELELLENNTLKSRPFQDIDPELEGPSPNKLINSFHTYLLESGLTEKKPSRIYNCWNHLKAVGPKGTWCPLNSTSWGLTWDGEKGVWVAGV